MRRRLSTGTPAWLATKLLKGGETVGVCLLASALLVSDEADDDAIAEVFEGMGRVVNPLIDLQGLWTDVLAQHPWMDGHMGPLVDWMDGASDSIVDTVRELCAFLATVSVWGCDEQADGDLLARVIQTMRMIETKTFHTGQYAFYTPEQAALMSIMGADELYTRDKTGEWALTSERRTLRNGGSFGDLWAGSGTRIIGQAMLMRAEGQDPTTVRWLLRDGDGMLLALAAVNMVVYNIGEQITLEHDRAFQDSWLAAHAAGFKRVHDLPPLAAIEPRW